MLIILIRISWVMISKVRDHMFLTMLQTFPHRYRAQTKTQQTTARDSVYLVSYIRIALE